MTAGIGDRGSITVVAGSTEPPQVWRAVYREVLEPAFPPSELVDLDTFLSYAADADARVWFAKTAQRVCGLAVVNRDPALGIGLLSYLAVEPSHRAAGAGSTLITELRRREPVLLVEIEDPGRHHDRGHGDPRRRVEFYHRHGVLEIDVPFFQPPVSPGQPPVDGMLLGLLTVDAPHGSIEAAAIRAYLRNYLAESGQSLLEPRSIALLEALAADRLTVRPLLPRPGEG